MGSRHVSREIPLGFWLNQEGGKRASSKRFGKVVGPGVSVDRDDNPGQSLARPLAFVQKGWRSAKRIKAYARRWVFSDRGAIILEHIRRYCSNADGEHQAYEPKPLAPADFISED
jgi:hypothetical protein